jgi:hypothetical protein
MDFGLVDCDLRSKFDREDGGHMLFRNVSTGYYYTQSVL